MTMSRLEAQYGGWKNGGGREARAFGVLIISALVMTISQVLMF